MNVPLSAHTTIKVGGEALFFITVKSKGTLLRVISALKYIEYPYLIIGAGSNLLASDKGFDGVVIKLGFREVVENGNFIYADAGASVMSVGQKAAELGLSGMEFACGIPATVGGAVVSNAGAHGSSVSEIVAMVDVLSKGEIISLDNQQCKFGYRKSIFQNRDYIVLGAYFWLKQDSPETIRKRIAENTQARINTQPKGASAGSVFRNPSGSSAGALIDGLGLKGTRIGGAVISEKHANFIINDGGATQKDILQLIKLIKKRVKDAYSITLKTEIEILD